MAIVLLCASGCAPEPADLAVPFAAAFGDQALSCGAPLPAGELTDLRFYVTDVRLFDDAGEAVNVELSVDGRWQDGAVALIDLEDGSGACQNGTPGSNAVLAVRIPPGDYRGIGFVIGVPFELNHADPLAARKPLDDSAMHWHWRSGYKFLRAGFASEARNHWLHLGSAGCEGTVQSITGCRYPNRVPVVVTDYEPGDRLVVDLAAMFDAFSKSVDPQSSCSSGPAEESCRQPFEVLGLDRTNGLGTGMQRLVRRAE